MVSGSALRSGAAPRRETIKVASYNVRQGVGMDWRRRPRRNLEVLGEIAADVVAMQEAGVRFGQWLLADQGQEALRVLGYEAIPLAPLPEPNDWFGNVLLVRPDTVEVMDFGTLSLPSPERRGAAVADLAVGDLRLRVVGMHLGLVGLWRGSQAQAVLDDLQRRERRLPTVMLGDLNEWSTNGPCLRRFSQAHHVAAPGPTFPTRMPIAALDRIVASADLVIEETQVHDTRLARRASDHLPVWARLSFGGPEFAEERVAAARAAGG